MKKFIVLVATIILGIFIAGTLILGSNANSVKSQTNTVQQRMILKVNEIDW